MKKKKKKKLPTKKNCINKLVSVGSVRCTSIEEIEVPTAKTVQWISSENQLYGFCLMHIQRLEIGNIAHVVDKQCVTGS